MSRQVPPPPPPPAASAGQGNLATVVYILYLAGLVFPLTAAVGVVIAYANRGDAPAWVATHYTFQIRTFWIGLLFIVAGSVLTLIFLGWLVLAAWVFWLIVRVVIGLRYLGDGRPLGDPESWLLP